MKRRMSLRQAFGDLLYLLVPLVLVYVFIVYPFLVFNPKYYRSNILPSFYAAAFSVVFFHIWSYFVVPRFIVGRCRSCGSKNMLFSYEKKFFCGDCGCILVVDNLRGYERWKIMVSSLVGPSSFIGVSIVVGFVLAGAFEFGLLFFAVLCAIYFPSVGALFLGLYKLFGRFASAFVHKHKGAAATIFFIIFCVLAFLLLGSYWMLLAKIFESIYGELKPTSQLILI